MRWSASSATSSWMKPRPTTKESHQVRGRSGNRLPGRVRVREPTEDARRWRRNVRGMCADATRVGVRSLSVGRTSTDYRKAHRKRTGRRREAPREEARSQVPDCQAKGASPFPAGTELSTILRFLRKHTHLTRSVRSSPCA